MKNLFVGLSEVNVTMCTNKRSKDHTPRAPEAFQTQMVLVGVASFNRKRSPRLDLDW